MTDYQSIPIRRVPMRSAAEIGAMLERCESDIFEKNYNLYSDAFALALKWVLDSEFPDNGLTRHFTKSEVDRRQEWIALGGDPWGWPEP